jgi:hypothetical protein
MEITNLQCSSFDSFLLGCCEHSEEPPGFKKLWDFLFGRGVEQLLTSQERAYSIYLDFSLINALS